LVREETVRIDALCCCVGPSYYQLLRRSLPVWLSGLDSLTIVTKPGDPAEQFFGPKTSIVTTNFFTEYGAFFNKGCALNLAYALAQPRDWVLHFDADILPPDDWYSRTLARLTWGHLHGTRRYSEAGEPCDEAAFWIYGFFCMWNVLDAPAIKWPLFEPWHSHAGNYDAEFAEYWPKSHWVDLGFKVIHFGEPRQNWFGPNVDSAELMRPLHAEQLHINRINARKPENRLVVPQPQMEVTLDRKNVEFAAAMVNLCAKQGPFAIKASLGDRNAVRYL
jgi:hypothetical protein